MSKKKQPAVKVHQVRMINTALLRTYKNNSNKQSRHIHEKLKENILAQGFDENIIVRPSKEEPGYFDVVSGNHRFMAGKSLGMEEFPCVVRDDWDDVEAEFQLVKRNYVRGKIDKDSFTATVNRLAASEDLSISDIMGSMGFEDVDAFAEYYKSEKKRDEAAARAASVAGPATQVKMLDDLGTVVSQLFAQYGESVPFSFIIFPAGQKKHLYVSVTPSLKRAMEAVAEKCLADSLDINIVLGGLLQIGLANTNFFDADDSELVKKMGEPREPADLE